MSSPTELRQQISQQIYDALKTGDVPPWRRGWLNDPCAGFPTNAATKARYSGVNPILLSISGFAKGYQSKFWGTYKQFQQLGANVCHGEKGTAITFFKLLTVNKNDKATGDDREKKIPLLRTYYVFNVEQTDGCDHLRVGNDDTGHDIADRHDEAEALMSATNANIRYGGNRAYFSPTTDHIQLPMRSQFPDMSEFYLTAMHELTHWSGAEARLNRKELSYGFEELVAEIGAAYTCTEIGLPITENMTGVQSYLDGWLSSIKEDPSFIFKASSHASKAADFLLSFRQVAAEMPEPAILA